MHLQEKGTCLKSSCPQKWKILEMLLGCLLLGSLWMPSTPWEQSLFLAPARLFPAQRLWFGFVLPWLNLVFSPRGKLQDKLFAKFAIFCVSISQEKVSVSIGVQRRQVETQVRLECNMICGCTDPSSVSTQELTLGLVTSEVFRKCFYINFPCVVLFPRGNM